MKWFRISSYPLRTFYMVFTYVVVFSLWWAFLIAQKNQQVYEAEVRLIQQRYAGDESWKTSTTFLEIQDKYKRQRAMILGEGIVFVLLISVGLYQVRRAIIREKELAEQKANFLHSVTHELKSPVASIRLNAQTALRDGILAEQRAQLMNNTLSDTDRLEHLIANILLAARIEHGETMGYSSRVNLSALAQRTAQQFSRNKGQVVVRGEIQPDVFFSGDEPALTSVFFNLTENAVKYSPPGAEVLLQLYTAEGMIHLKVSDRGPGIPASEREKIFQKFYRIGSEETRTTQGTGLGLYIVSRIVLLCNGTVQVLDREGGGSVFSVSLPVG